MLKVTLLANVTGGTKTRKWECIMCFKRKMVRLHIAFASISKTTSHIIMASTTAAPDRLFEDILMNFHHVTIEIHA